MSSYQPKYERGVILVVVLVMLAVMMLVVVALVQTSNINFKIAGNQQYKLEAKTTAQHGIETFLSNSANFTLPLPTASSVIGVDLNGDGVDDMEATVTPPSCLSATVIGLSELDFSNPEDSPCFGSAAMQNTGILSDTSASQSGNSWCSEMLWNLQSTVDDAITSAQVTLNQGVYTRAIIGTTCE